MKAATRLGLYGLVLVVVFAVAGFTANAVIDKETVQNWVEETPEDDHGEGDEMTGTGQAHEHEGQGADSASRGLSLSRDGFQLIEVTAPTETDTAGELSLAVRGPEGNPVTDFDLDHGMEMHLITVRADGQHFRHVHPDRDDAGTWSIPWEWEAAGTYRIFADFVPAETSESITLSTSVQVAGDYDPALAGASVTQTEVNGFDISVEGEMTAGEASELTLTITRDGEPVTELEPYLGAFGHLVALRHGDLAYLHVHPHADAPGSGETSGPEIVFEATAPTSGRYLLYLDFQVENEVHTAPLAIDVAAVTGESHDANGNPENGSDTASDTADDQEEGESHDH